MSDDRNKDQSGNGFDDWLDDEPGPVSDPYKMLASEETTDERRQTTGDEPTLDEADETSEIEAIVEDDSTDDESVDDESTLDEADETSEIEAIVEDDSTDDESVDDESTLDEADGTSEIEAIVEDDSTDDDEETEDDHDDTGELEVVAGDDDEAVVEEPSGVSYQPLDDHTDTEELEPVASIGFGDLWDDEADADVDPASSGTSPELFDMTQEDFLHTATKEHAGLAESIALADDEETEMVALAAPIPGLDATVVGFEDVVEAEGHGRVRARGSGDLVARVITGVVLIVALGASLLWQPALVVLALGVFVLGAGEFYTALARSGRKPIALFGFIGIVGASLGAFFSGAIWIPLAFALAVTLLLLFYAVVPGRVDPMANLALTITVMVWAGLGSFAMLIIKSDAYRMLVFGVVVAVVAMDVAQYFFGRALGRHQLSPWVSPKKTIEGLVAGIVVALVVGALLHFLRPFELTSGLAIGVAVAVFAPMGDLAMSAAKRSLGLKDMGSVLPGHGGFLDRIDGLIFVIPVAWGIFVWAGIL